MQYCVVNRAASVSSLVYLASHSWSYLQTRHPGMSGKFVVGDSSSEIRWNSTCNGSHTVHPIPCLPASTRADTVWQALHPFRTKPFSVTNRYYVSHMCAYAFIHNQAVAA